MAVNERARRWRERNPEAHKAAKKRSRAKHPDTAKLYSKKYAEENAERLKDYRAAYRSANPELMKARDRAAYDKDPEGHWARLNKWKAANPEKVAETQRRGSSKFKKANRAAATALEVKRHARKQRALPAWSNLRLIAEFYALARLRSAMTGLQWQVDHIVPLNSDLVCGLHCEANLQVIPARLNLAKSNDWWPDMWDATPAPLFFERPSHYLVAPARVSLPAPAAANEDTMVAALERA